MVEAKSLVTMTHVYMCAWVIKKGGMRESRVNLMDAGGPTTCSVLLSSESLIHRRQSFIVIYYIYSTTCSDFSFSGRPDKLFYLFEFIHFFFFFFYSVHSCIRAFSLFHVLITHIWKHMRMRIYNFLIISILQHWRLISQKAVSLWVHMSQQSLRDKLFKTSLMWKMMRKHFPFLFWHCIEQHAYDYYYNLFHYNPEHILV